MTTIACLYVRGEYPYTPEYVTRLERMVARWIDRPYRFVCLTDQPWAFQPPVETIPIVKWPGSTPWSKLELFHVKHSWPGRVLYLDIDVLIVAPLAPILDFPATFAITADPPALQPKRTRDRFGRAIVRRYNSSVMVWDGPTTPLFASGWTPADAERLSGDQDYLGEGWPDLPTMPRAWFPRLSEVGAPPWPDETKVILSKVPKNELAAKLYPWFEPWWGAA